MKNFTSLFTADTPSTIIAKSERIYFREITKKDASFMLDLMNQENWLAYIGDRSIRSIADAKTHIENGPMRSYKINGFGTYMVIDNISDRPIGICGLLKRTYLDAPDLGFAISKPFYRQGYGFEAAQLTLKMVNKWLDMHVVYATVKTDNAGSIQLLHKLGFQLQASTGLALLGREADDLLLYKKDLSANS